MHLKQKPVGSQRKAVYKVAEDTQGHHRFSPTHVCETWTVSEQHGHCLNGLYQNCLRNMMKITWQD